MYNSLNSFKLFVFIFVYLFSIFCFENALLIRPVDCKRPSLHKTTEALPFTRRQPYLKNVMKHIFVSRNQTDANQNNLFELSKIYKIKSFLLLHTSSSSSTKNKSNEIIEKRKYFAIIKYLLSLYILNDATCVATSLLNLFLASQHIYIKLPDFLCEFIHQHNEVHQKIRQKITKTKFMQKIVVSPILEEIEFRWFIQEICLRHLMVAITTKYQTRMKQQKYTSFHSNPTLMNSSNLFLNKSNKLNSTKLSKQQQTAVSFCIQKLQQSLPPAIRIIISATLFALPHHQPIQMNHTYAKFKYTTDRNSASVVSCIKANRVITAFGQGLLWGTAQELLHNPLYCVLLHTFYNLQQTILILSMHRYLSFYSNNKQL